MERAESPALAWCFLKLTLKPQPGCKLKSHERIFRTFNAHSTQRKIYLVWSVVQLLKIRSSRMSHHMQSGKQMVLYPAPSLFHEKYPSDPIPLPEIQITSGLPLLSIFSISLTSLSTRHRIIREYTEFLLAYVLTVHILNIPPASEYNSTSVLLHIFSGQGEAAKTTVTKLAFY